MGEIYKITNPSGHVYIGQSINMRKRLQQYKNGWHKNQIKLTRSISKHGWNSHTVEIIESVENGMLNAFGEHIHSFNSIAQAVENLNKDGYYINRMGVVNCIKNKVQTHGDLIFRKAA